jgi:hypothetical protein
MKKKLIEVALHRWDELPGDWDPAADCRTQHPIRRLYKWGEVELAYRHYTLWERKDWADEAGYHNSLVIAWPALQFPELLQEQ